MGLDGISIATLRILSLKDGEHAMFPLVVNKNKCFQAIMF